MLWIIVGAIVGLVIGILVSIDEYYTFWEGVGITFLIILLCVCIGMMGVTMSGAIADCCAEKTYYTVEDVDVYALQDNLTTEGNFFLGSGHIDDELKYFYVKQTDVGYTVSNVDADKSYIQYTDDRCHVVRQDYTFDNWFVRLIAFPMSERYIFYIPEGSVINNYAVDLK